MKLHLGEHLALHGGAAEERAKPVSNAAEHRGGPSGDWNAQCASLPLDGQVEAACRVMSVLLVGGFAAIVSRATPIVGAAVEPRRRKSYVRSP
jgi:hypothetical protein